MSWKIFDGVFGKVLDFLSVPA